MIHKQLHASKEHKETGSNSDEKRQLVKQEIEEANKDFKNDMSGLWSYFDEGLSQARSKGTRPPSRNIRKPADNSNTCTNSPSKVRKITQLHNYENSNMMNSSKGETTVRDPCNEAPPLKRLENMTESQESMIE